LLYSLLMNEKHIKAVGQGDPVTLSSPKSVEKFLLGMVARIGMRVLGSPHIYKEDHGGVSGLVVLSTSHVALHTRIRKVKDITYGFFTLDVYSCRVFPDEPVRETLIEFFSASAVSVTDLSDSLRFP
jgi:S-adenosylmethionine decarboxylase